MRQRLPLALGLLAAAVTLGLPPLLTDYQLGLYILIALATIVVAGLSLLMGYAGQVSLGQAAFYAVGAYGAGLLAKRGVPAPLALLAAPGAAWVVAAVIGVPLLRLRGHHLAFATLAFQVIVLSVIAQARGVTGGDIGLRGIPVPTVGGFEISGTAFAYLTWTVTAGVLLLTHNLVRSRPGRALRALATSEAAAAAAGIPIARYKLQVFALSAAYAGIAGGLYGLYLGYISPVSFPVLLSIQFLVMAVVGGLGAVWGSVVGAAAITLLVEALKQIGEQPGMPSHAPAFLSYAVYAVVLIAVLLFLPEGLLPALLGRLRPAGRAG